MLDHGRILSTRSRGAEAAERIDRVAADPGDVVLDFAGVEIATPPFLQQIVDIIATVVARSSDTGRIILLANLNEDVRETLAYVLAKHRGTVVVQEGNQIGLLEGEDLLVETFDHAKRLGSFTAPQLASDLNIKGDNATHRLKRLLAFGALVREEDPSVERGRRHLYRAATPPAKTISRRSPAR